MKKKKKEEMKDKKRIRQKNKDNKKIMVGIKKTFQN